VKSFDFIFSYTQKNFCIKILGPVGERGQKGESGKIGVPGRINKK